MATNKTQKKWRDRVKKGLVAQNPICPVCGKKCRADSKRSPYHFNCWRTTAEGKKFLAKRKRESRKNKI